MKYLDLEDDEVQDPLESLNGLKPKTPTRIQVKNTVSGRPITGNLSLLISGATLFLVLINLFATMGKPSERYAYIQMADGKVIGGQALDNLQRSDDTIVFFVENWLLLSHNWSGKLPNGKPDPGARANGSAIPTALMLGSKALTPGFSQSYVRSLQEKYNQKYPLSRYVNNQGHEVVLKILHIATPTRSRNQDGSLSTGVWDVRVQATRIHYFQGEHVANEPFNQVIRVQAIRPYSNPLGEQASPLVREHQAMQRSGLAINTIFALTANQ